MDQARELMEALAAKLLLDLVLKLMLKSRYLNLKSISVMDRSQRLFQWLSSMTQKRKMVMESQDLVAKRQQTLLILYTPFSSTICLDPVNGLLNSMEMAILPSDANTLSLLLKNVRRFLKSSLWSLELTHQSRCSVTFMDNTKI